MARPIKWSRDLHLLREAASRSRTETWSRHDIESLFGVGRASAQTLIKAVGAVQTVGAAHFVNRTSLLAFLEEMIAADSVEAALQRRIVQAEPAPRPKPLRVSLPHDLKHAMLPNLPGNIVLSPGKIEITANSATAMVEALMTLAMVMQNDLDRWEQAISHPVSSAPEQDEDLRRLISHLRENTFEQRAIATSAADQPYA